MSNDTTIDPVQRLCQSLFRVPVARVLGRRLAPDRGAARPSGTRGRISAVPQEVAGQHAGPHWALLGGDAGRAQGGRRKRRPRWMHGRRQLRRRANTGHGMAGSRSIAAHSTSATASTAHRGAAIARVAWSGVAGCLGGAWTEDGQGSSARGGGGGEGGEAEQCCYAAAVLAAVALGACG